MTTPYTMYGLPTSMFSASTRAYLRFKGLPFVEKVPSMYTYMVRAKSRCGSPQAPILIDSEGTWMADTSEIIDELERRHPEVPVVPTTPKQRFASYLFELWGNEFWYSSALHTRWSHRENYDIWEADMCRMLPSVLPMRLRGFLLRNTAQKMLNAHIPTTGVVPENFDIIDEWTNHQLDLLESHFAHSPHTHLFGDRPSVGDMGLVIPLYGHLYLDPWSREHLIDTRANLRSWIERMQNPRPLRGEFLPGDVIPPTLEPLLLGMCHDIVPYLQETLRELRKHLSHSDDRDRLPRMLDMVDQPMGEREIHRKAMPYTLWMTQRLIDVYRAMREEDALTVREWLAEIGGQGFLELDLPRLRRVGLHAAIAD